MSAKMSANEMPAKISDVLRNHVKEKLARGEVELVDPFTPHRIATVRGQRLDDRIQVERFRRGQPPGPEFVQLLDQHLHGQDASPRALHIRLQRLRSALQQPLRLHLHDLQRPVQLLRESRGEQYDADPLEPVNEIVTVHGEHDLREQHDCKGHGIRKARDRFECIRAEYTVNREPADARQKCEHRGQQVASGRRDDVGERRHLEQRLGRLLEGAGQIGHRPADPLVGVGERREDLGACIDQLDDLRRLRTPELSDLRDAIDLVEETRRRFVLNVSEDVLGAASDLLERMAAGEDVDLEQQEGELKGIATIAKRGKAEGAEVVAVSASLEAELAELPEEDAAEYLESLGLPRLGADRVVQVGYRLLNLITFLTAGEDEVRAWTVTKGAKAPEAAGKIHSDIERGFIRAEVTRYEDFMNSGGSFAAAAKKGLQRLEGKEYVIQDGDIAHFRFNVGKS